MKICIECFEDSEIKNIIRSLNESGTCDVLHQDSSYIYDTKKHDVLTPLFESLIDIYTPVKSCKISVDSKKYSHLGVELKISWDIFSPICDIKTIEEIIKNICKDKYMRNSNIFDEPIVLEEKFDTAYKQNHSLFKNCSWEDFKKHLIEQNRYHARNFNAELFQRFCWTIPKKYKAGKVFYRARISPDEHGYSLQEMQNPNPQKSKAGRANAAGIQCLYLADHTNTTVSEVRAGNKDFITIATFELQQDIWVVDFKRINQISPFFDQENIPLIDYAINKEYLNEINQEMAKVVRGNDSLLDYVPTQYICDFVKTIERQESGRTMHFSGVEYNSTLYSEGYNIAIFEPNVLKAISTEVHQVTSLQYITQITKTLA